MSIQQGIEQGPVQGIVQGINAEDAPEFVAEGTVAAAAGAITIAWPTHQANDVGILYLVTANQEITLTTPSGFVEVDDSPQGTGAGGDAAAVRLTVFWARATSASMANVVTSDSGDFQAGAIATFRGCIASGNPWSETSGGTAASSTSASVAGLTTSLPYTTVLTILAHSIDAAGNQVSAWANTSLKDFAERGDWSRATGTGGGIATASGTKIGAGVVAASAATLAAASAQAFMCLALKGKGR